MVTPNWIEDIDLGTNPYLNLIHKIRINSLDHLTTDEIRIYDQLDPQNTLKSLILLSLQKNIHISNIVKELNWKEFEILISAILEQFDWDITLNFRFFGEGAPRDRKRYEIDILARKDDMMLLIDCKRYKIITKSIIEKAARLQKERTYELFEMLPILYQLPEFTKITRTKVKMYPIIVTWRENNLTKSEEICVSSANRFVDLLIQFDTYKYSFDWFFLKWEHY
ncbi:MAG: restriction endonuclease [Candidatus Heimdallarchaeota archaeon]|nr:restriction endonuclease [Candidatus Heimdallarchaeota archaeon]